jgi:hypothetical protein
VSYFKTSQGLDATYDLAVEYFRGSEALKKMTIMAEPKGYRQKQSLPADAPCFGYFINTEPYLTLKTCITDPSTIKAMIALIRQNASIGQSASKATPSSKKTPVTVSKEGHRVTGKRPASQSQGSGFQGRFAPSPGPTAKSPPYRQGVGDMKTAPPDDIRN